MERRGLSLLRSRELKGGKISDWFPLWLNYGSSSCTPGTRLGSSSLRDITRLHATWDQGSFTETLVEDLPASCTSDHL